MSGTPGIDRAPEPMTRNGIPRSQELLLQILRGRPSGDLAESAGATDWITVASEATPSLLPYLAFRAEELIGRDTVAGEGFDRLRDARRSCALLQLQRQATLRTVLATLEAHRIPALVLKGMALAHLVYPDPGLRPMQDMDLWVPRDQLDDAVRAVATAGLRRPRRKYLAESTLHAERALELPGTPILVELQGAPSSLTSLPVEFTSRAWERSEAVSLGGIPARVLHRDDLLIHLALHALHQHQFETGLLPLLDLRLTIERWRNQWDWEAMARDYQSLGIAGPMYLTLSLGRELVGAGIPERFFAVLPPPRDLGEMQRLAWDQLRGPVEPLRQALAGGLTARTLPQRARWLLARATIHYTRQLPWTGGGPAAFREVARRLLFDLSVTLPRYIRGWFRGDLRGAELRRRAALARGRERLTELLGRGDAIPGAR